MKKIMSIAVALIMVFALAAPAMAAEAGEKENVHVNNAGFHCGTFGGNGRAWVGNYEDGMHEFEHIGGVSWKLVRDDYVCPICGQTDWVSFSNNSGVPDGKNIQLNHLGDANGGPGGDGGAGTLGAIEIVQEVMVTVMDTKTIEKWQGEKTPYQVVTQFVSPGYSSVTATTLGQLGLLPGMVNPKNGNLDSKHKDFNKLVVPNANHFTFAELPIADLDTDAGVELALVVGNKVDEVGAGSVKINGDGMLEITFDGDLYSCKFGAAAFAKLPEPKNGNIHSLAGFKHDNAAVIDMPDPVGDNIYLYVHFDNLTYDLGTDTSEVEWKVTKEPVVVWSKTVPAPQGPVQEFIEVKVFCAGGDGDGYVDEIDLGDLASLEPGIYTVVFYDEYLDAPLEKVVEVVAGEPLKAEYKAAYEKEGEELVKKISLPFIEKPLEVIKKTVVK